MRNDAEWKLIQECRRGRSAAFEPLVLRYQSDALAFAETMLLDRDEAADVVQEAFVRAYRGLRTLAEGSAFGPWFRTIVRNLCHDRLRALARRRHEPFTPEIEGTMAVSPEVTQRLEHEQLAQSIGAALAMLSPAHREVLVLKEIEGLGYAEIARVLGVPQGTVASRVFHARTALKRALHQAGVAASEVA